MTKKEAIQAMRKGHKVTHRYFTSEEYITMDSQDNIVTEEGYKTPEANFWTDRISESWEEGWELWKRE